MCGICGVIGGNAPDAVARMVQVMHARGPDDHGQWEGRGVSLGHTRLSIVDLSAAGHQPMFNDDETIVIVYNGELYNFQDKRAELEALGIHFRSSSDTEVVLKLYEHYGDSFVDHLRGMFALVIHDMRGAGRTVLVRDQLGIKPLLFTLRDNRLIFASELKPLLASGLVPVEIDPVAVRLLLSYGSIYQPRTLVKGVQSLPAAHMITIDGGKVRARRYWSLETGRYPELADMPYDDQVTHFREVIRDSLRRQLVSDAPLGAFLSGGADSASLVAFMAAETGTRIKTFSVGFESDLKGFDETDEAAHIAEFLGTDHNRVQVSERDLRDNLVDIILGLDQPSVDGVNTWLVSRATSQQVKVAISGTGGDDLFVGYPWHATMLARASQRPAGDDPEFLNAYADAANAFHVTFGADGAARMMAPHLRPEAGLGTPFTRDLTAIDELAKAGIVDRMTALTLRGYTANQLLRDIDAMSMANSLEVRVPYLDPVVIDTALSLPTGAKISKPVPVDPMRNSYRDSGIKRILCDAARPFLPEGFDRVPKRGFGIPFGVWLARGLGDVVGDVFRPQALADTGVLDPAMADPVVNAYRQNKINGWRLWLLLVLELWTREARRIASTGLDAR